MKEKTIGVDIEELDNTKYTENSEEISKDINFEKPKFLQEEKNEKITSAQKGTLMHLCMQKLNPKEQYDLQKIQDLINHLEQNQIITESGMCERRASHFLNIRICGEVRHPLF